MTKEKKFKLLVLNPGSTSTKLGLYENEKEIKEKVIRHEKEELDKCRALLDQKPLRLKCIYDFLYDIGVDEKELDAIISRGGLVKAIESGTYAINDAMYEDLHKDKATMHASALGGVLAYEMSKKLGIPCFVVDPVVVDEMIDVARVSGMKGIERRSAFHALNQKAVARKHSKIIGKKYEDCNFVVAHMGGGISIGAHRKGKVIDVNDALCGEGPFSPERAGTLPLMGVMNLAYSGEYSKDELIKIFSKRGGMYTYLGTNDFREIEDRVEAGDKEATFIVDAMAYQIAKNIGSMVAALKSDVDAVILTGGLPYYKRFANSIAECFTKITKVAVYPGEMEMEALALGGYRVLSGEENVKKYM